LPLVHEGRHCVLTRTDFEELAIWKFSVNALKLPELAGAFTLPIQMSRRSEKMIGICQTLPSRQVCQETLCFDRSRQALFICILVGGWIVVGIRFGSPCESSPRVPMEPTILKLSA
jgi:hypothetical protein